MTSDGARKLSFAEFRDGMRDGLPLLFSVLPFGLILGALAAERGMSMLQATVQSAVFFAGASQVLAVELMGDLNSAWVIGAAVFAVNFRMLLYSAAIGRRLMPTSTPKMLAALFLLQDISFVLGVKRADAQGLSFAYYLGVSLLVYAVWIAGTMLGVLFGGLIEDPHAVGLDLLVPVYFLTMMMGFRTKPNAVPIFAVSASVAAITYIAVGSPYHIAAGGVAGMLIAAIMAPNREVLRA